MVLKMEEMQEGDEWGQRCSAVEDGCSGFECLAIQLRL